jgi:outer membrane protein assembly factor BamB
MVGQDAAHTASSDGPDPPYRVSWSASVGPGGPAAGPVVAEGVIVVVAQRGISGLDAASGELLWSASRNSGPAGGAAVAADLVVHASGGRGDASVVGRQLSTGKEVWRAHPRGPVSAALTVADGVVFAGTDEGVLHGFDAATGEERLRFEADGAIRGPAAAGGDVVLAVWEERSTGRATVRAFDRRTLEDDAAPVWQSTTGPGPLPSAGVAVSGDAAFVVAGDGTARGLGLADGEQRWLVSIREVAAPGQIPAAGPPLLVVDRLHLTRLDPTSGEEEWSFRLGDARPIGDEVNTLSDSVPAIAGTAGVVGDTAGVVSAVDLETGRRVWRRDLGGAAVAAPAADGERLYVATLGPEGKVIALEHDPDGVRLAEPSPTVLFPLRALLNFGVAFFIVTLIILALFRVLPTGRSGTGGAAA